MDKKYRVWKNTESTFCKWFAKTRVWNRWWSQLFYIKIFCTWSILRRWKWAKFERRERKRIKRFGKGAEKEPKQNRFKYWWKNCRKKICSAGREWTEMENGLWKWIIRQVYEIYGMKIWVNQHQSYILPFPLPNPQYLFILLNRKLGW